MIDRLVLTILGTLTALCFGVVIIGIYQDGVQVNAKRAQIQAQIDAKATARATAKATANKTAVAIANALSEFGATVQH